MPEKPICQVCRLPRPYVYTIRKGFRICQRCVAVVAKNAYDGLKHRPTLQYVNTSLSELAESLTLSLGGLMTRLKALEDRLALLERQAGVTPVCSTKAQIIQDLRAAEPDITVRQIQARTGIKADTIRRVISRLRQSEDE